MSKQRKTSRLLAGSSLVLLIIAACLGLTREAPGVSAETNWQAKVNPSAQSAAATEALKTSFGSSLSAVMAFKPFYLTGDFNGDAAPDILMVVRINGRQNDLPPDVKVFNPFERPKAIFPDDPAANPTLAFAIIHGGKAGWQTSPAAEKFLLFGNSPILILQYQRATSDDPGSAGGLQLLKKNSRRLRDLGWPPTAAKGDSIVLGTEATDSILYWNGRNYRWEEASGGE